LLKFLPYLALEPRDQPGCPQVDGERDRLLLGHVSVEEAPGVAGVVQAAVIRRRRVVGGAKYGKENDGRRRRKDNCKLNLKVAAFKNRFSPGLPDLDI
jgi:hypothetical protein